MSPRINASKVEIEEQWTLDDVLDAHEVLDLLEELEHRASKPRASW